MAQQKAVEPVIDEDLDLIDELQPGAKLLKGQYTIVRYLNSGGFGITYLAKDSLDRDVVIKECFPSSVCRRSKAVVAARSRAHTAELRSIVQLFVREARNLAKIVHPNIVAVHQVFEDNGTAYMAIDYIDGLDLQQIIEGEGPRITPDHVVSITEKLLHAVGFIHDSDMLHRDISPDNVLIDQSGEPILIDFGAAREKASQTNRAMSALRVVKDGYSPQEFYIAGSEQGPWSDLYALGATLYHLISDEAPVNGQARLAALAEDKPDPYVPLTGRFEGFPDGFLEAIDRALCTLPKQRLQTAREWLAMFRGGPVGLAMPPAGEGGGVDDAVLRLVAESRDDTTDTAEKSDASGEATAPVQPKRISRTPDPVAVPAARGNASVQLAAGMALALVVVAGGYLMLGPKSAATSPDEPAALATDVTTSPATTDVAATEVAATEATDSATIATADQATPLVAPPDVVTDLSTETVPETATATETAIAATTDLGSDVAPDATTATATTDTATDIATETSTGAAATETTATPVEAVVTEPAAATAEPVAAEPEPEAAPVEVAEAAETVPVAEAATAEAIAPEATTVPATETPAAVTAEPAAATPEVPVLTTPAGKPAENQIAFAAWDVAMPFVSDDRMINGQRVAVVTQLPPASNPREAGDWLAPGIMIYSVNNTPIASAGSLTVAIMNAMAVDPDGKARVVVEYSDTSLVRESGLLTVGAVRLVSLANGIGTRTSVVDGVWKTEVTDIINPDVTTLRQGDVLFRDKTTTIPLDGPDTLETILADLVAQGVMQTQFSIIRGNKVAEAAMLLAPEAGE